MKHFLPLLILAAALPAAEPATLDALVAQIVAENPELRFYEAELDAARAGRTSAGALGDPSLAVTIGRKRAEDAAGILAGEGTAWSVSVSQTFEWPGRLALRKNLANRQVELAELGLERFRGALAARARTLAYGLHAARGKASAQAEVAARYRELREVFLQRDPAGLTPQLEIRVIEAQELVLQRRATDAALQVQRALAELNQLRGASPLAPLEPVAGPLAFGAAPPLDELLAAARDHNFDFRAAKLELEQQGFAVSLAQHERRPAVTVSPYFSEESAGDRERIFGVGFSLPLAVTARSKAAVVAAEARRRQAEVAVGRAQRQLEHDVTAAAQTFAAKTAEVAAWSADAAGKFRDAAALADRHYRLGAVPIATYVELQNAYLDAVEAWYDTQREALESGQQLELLTGLSFHPVEAQP